VLQVVVLYPYDGTPILVGCSARMRIRNKDCETRVDKLLYFKSSVTATVKSVAHRHVNGGGGCMHGVCRAQCAEGGIYLYTVKIYYVIAKKKNRMKNAFSTPRT
jgi:hypothetical protein